MKKFIKEQSLKVSALVMIGLVSGAEDAAAQAGGQASWNQVGGNIIDAISQLPGLVTGVSYMLGILLAVLGILKVKDHVENPSQTPLQHGLIRLAAGGGLFALPIITESMTTLLDPDGTATGAITAVVPDVAYGGN